MISATVAGLAGILIAPISPLTPISYTLFVIPALAAALVGGFQHLVPRGRRRPGHRHAPGRGDQPGQHVLVDAPDRRRPSWSRSSSSWSPCSSPARPCPPAAGSLRHPLGRAPRPRVVLFPAVVRPRRRRAGARPHRRHVAQRGHRHVHRRRHRPLVRGRHRVRRPGVAGPARAGRRRRPTRSASSPRAGASRSRSPRSSPRSFAAVDRRRHRAARPAAAGAHARRRHPGVRLRHRGGLVPQHPDRRRQGRLGRASPRCSAWSSGPASARPSPGSASGWCA